MLAQKMLASVAVAVVVTLGGPVAQSRAQGQPAPAADAGVTAIQQQGAPGMAGGAPMVSCQCPKAMHALPAAVAVTLVGLGALLVISVIAALLSLSVFLVRRSRVVVPA